MDPTAISGSDGTALLMGEVESRRVALLHFVELSRYLQEYLQDLSLQNRAVTRQVLVKLTPQQFQELSTDTYGELVRRRGSTDSAGQEVLSLPVQSDFHAKRTAAHQKLALLPTEDFNDLSSDVCYELLRRHPQLADSESSAMLLSAINDFHPSHLANRQDQNQDVDHVPLLEQALWTKIFSDDELGLLETVQLLPQAEIVRQTTIYQYIATEEQFLRDLNTVMKLFVQPLEASDILKKADQINFLRFVFGNIENLRKRQSELLKKLHRRQRQQFPIVDHIGDILLDVAPQIQVECQIYVDQHMPYAEKRLAEEIERNEKFDSFLKATYQDMPKEQLVRCPTLGHLITRPSEYLHGYLDRLKGLLDETEIENPDVRYLSDAMDTIAANLDILGVHTLHPDLSKPIDLTGQIAQHNRHHFAFGGYADVYQGTLNGTDVVALKVLKHYHDDSDEVRQRKEKRLRRELRVWNQLRHRNVLPLLGVAADFGVYLAMVCPWMDGGDLSHYLAKYRTSLSRRHRWGMVRDVALGLIYLHENKVIHGDLTGSNILLDSRGTCLLCDFGLSKILEEFKGTSYMTSTLPGSIRWAAPELLIHEDDSNSGEVHVTHYSDIFSFGRVIYQTLTGAIPFHPMTDMQVIFTISRGTSPKRTEDIIDNEWNLLTELWNPVPTARPELRACSLLQSLIATY